MSRLLLEGGTLIGLADRGDVYPGTDLYAEGGSIRATGREARALAAAPGEPVERLDARGRWVIPGFVQAHLHLCQTILRNGPEDLELLPWLERHVWPGEAAHDPETLDVSARLGLAECLASGVTAVLDMGTVRHSDALFRAAGRAGIRYTGGNVLMDDPDATPINLRARADDGLAETERLRSYWQGRDRGRLTVAVQPRFVVTCTERLLRMASEYAAGHELIVHTHASENRSEVDLVRARTGMGNLAYLDRLGLLTGRTCIAHVVHPEEGDGERLASGGASVLHCPSSNLKLSSGVCPVPALKAAGVRVALGSDAAACNDHLDPFQEMRLASFLPRTATPPGRLSAFDVLRMATWEGATALDLPGANGLAPGGRADLVVLDPDAAWAAPHEWSPEPFGAIVYSMGPGNVVATVVDGVVRHRGSDPTVMGLKPRPDQIKDAVKKLRSRM